MSERSRHTPPSEQIGLPVATELRRIASLDTSLIDPDTEIRETYRTLFSGDTEKIAQLAPHELVFLFEELQKWLPIADAKHSAEVAYLHTFLTDNTITLGMAMRSTDTTKVNAYILRLAKALKKHAPLLDEIYTSRDIQKQKEQESTPLEDTSFFDTFDPSLFSFETISEHTERLMLSIMSALDRREHKEMYVPILESLDRAIAQSLQTTMQETNRAYYTPGRIRLADIKSRMSKEHWGTLCALWHIYPELYQYVLGNLPDETDDSNQIVLQSTPTKSTNNGRSPDIALANVLCIALSEEIKAANTGDDQVRPAARQTLDEWYGPHTPKRLFEHEDIFWNITLTEAIETIQEKSVRDRLQIIQKELPKRLTKENCVSALESIGTLFNELAHVSSHVPDVVRQECTETAQRYTDAAVNMLDPLCTDVMRLSAGTQHPDKVTGTEKLHSLFRYWTTYSKDKETYKEETKRLHQKTKACVCDILHRIQALAESHPETVSVRTYNTILRTFFARDHHLASLFQEEASRHDVTEAEVETIYDLRPYRQQMEWSHFAAYDHTTIDFRGTRLPDNCANLSFRNRILGRDEVVHIIKTNKDIRGADLSKAHLDGVDLNGTDLRETRLPKDCVSISFAGVQLGYDEVKHILQTNKNLRGADLREAQLQGIDLLYVDLRETLLPEDCVNVSFTGTQLERGQILHITKKEKNLSGAVLVGIDLHGIHLDGADLHGANLSHADLNRVDLRYANFSYADLSYANLSHANLYWANFSYADLRYANLRLANLRWANLRKADLRGADLSGANLTEVNLRVADLRYANLSYTDLSGANLREVNLNGVDLRGATLPEDCTGVSFAGAILEKSQKKYIIKHNGKIN